MAVYGETGRYPLLVRQKILLIKYWLRLVNFESTGTLSKAYKHLINSHMNGERNWMDGTVHNIIVSIIIVIIHNH